MIPVEVLVGQVPQPDFLSSQGTALTSVPVQDLMDDLF